MGYKTKDIKIYKEEDFDVAPASPKVYKLKVSSIDLSDEQRSKKYSILGNGHEPTHSKYGGFDYAGSLGMFLGGDYMPFICEGVIGEATTKTEASSDSHSATTVYAKGDIVNHSDGVHSLVCYKGGTSASSEPTIDVAEYKTITDGTVTWIVRKKLFKMVGELQACLKSFCIERAEEASCGNAPVYYEKHTGLIMSVLETKKEGEEITFEMSQSLKGLDSDDSVKNESYTPLITGTELSENFFSENDVDVEISNDGVTWFKLDELDSLSLSIDRPCNIKGTMNGRRPSFGIAEISGSATGLFGSTLYQMSFEKQEKFVRFTYSQPNGDKCVITYTNIKFGNNKKNASADEDTMIEVKLSGAGNSSMSSVNYECITSVDL